MELEQQDGLDVEGLLELNGHVKSVGLLLGPASSGVLAVGFDGPEAIAKFKEIFGRAPTDLPSTVGVTSGKRHAASSCFKSIRTGGASPWAPPLEGHDTHCLSSVGTVPIVAGDHPETTGYRWLPNSSPADE